MTPVASAVQSVVAETPAGGLIPQKATARIVDVAMDLAKPIIVDTIKTGFELTGMQADRIERQIKEAITDRVAQVDNDNYRQQFAIKAKTAEEIEQAEKNFSKDEVSKAVAEIERKQQAEFDRLQNIQGCNL